MVAPGGMRRRPFFVDALSGGWIDSQLPRCHLTTAVELVPTYLFISTLADLSIYSTLHATFGNGNGVLEVFLGPKGFLWNI